eukprot:TRINITY_DN45123_c0_g1_i1.p1 TRINITY_DN45123_c0_g1~~TRINITY_DN45123_c0_g1_i1.p1  ORF type:complete len:540 (-),score=141.73 TRINITY_DN45123_c0_g1_i1:43-1662(-)
MQAQITGRSVDEHDGVTYYDIEVTSSGRTWQVRRRYNNFVDLDQRLQTERSLSRRELPKKDIFGLLKGFDIGQFNSRRQADLQRYINHLLQQSSSTSSQALARFLGADSTPAAAASSSQRSASSTAAAAVAALTAALTGTTGPTAARGNRFEISNKLFTRLIQAFGDAPALRALQPSQVQKLRQTEEEERDCLVAMLESKFRGSLPKFYQGSFGDAVSAARTEKRLLLVWLYDGSPISDSLFRDVMQGEAFAAFVNEYYVLWAGDAQRWLVPVQLRRVLRLEGLPALVVLKPLSVYDVPQLGDPKTGVPVEFPLGSAWSLLGAWDSSSEGNDEQMILSFLGEHGDTSVEALKLAEEERRFQREYTEQARALREEQDREMEESLQKDRERLEALELDRQAAEEEQQRDQQREQEEQQRDQQREQEKTRLIEARLATAKRFMELESEQNSSEEKCKLVLRLPGGQRIERTFGADDTLEKVYDWADCCGELSSLTGGEHIDVPASFQIATTYPRALLLEKQKSLRELQLLPNAMLALTSSEE